MSENLEKIIAEQAEVLRSWPPMPGDAEQKTAQLIKLLEFSKTPGTVSINVTHTIGNSVSYQITKENMKHVENFMVLLDFVEKYGKWNKGLNAYIARSGQMRGNDED